ncbi:hypothetical protein BOX15_Mlig004166g1, partial [Macrostomum lignano]
RAMVLFDNIAIGQNVEVKHLNELYPAKVRYKGGLNSMKGDWVGLELYEPVGYTDGLYRGHRYFFVRKDYGIFVTADQIRFPRMKRRLFNKYKVADPEQATTDASLFNTQRPATADPRDPVYLSDEYSRLAMHRLPSAGACSLFEPPRNYHLKQSCVKKPPEPPEPEKPAPEFISPASIPDYVVPPSVLRRHVARHRDNPEALRFPKHHSLHTIRDFLHSSNYWNDMY